PPGGRRRTAEGWQRFAETLPERARQNPYRGQPVAARTSPQPYRARFSPQAGVESATSSPEPGEDLGFHLFPGDGRLRVGPVCGQPSIHFMPLGLREWHAFEV